MMNIALFHQDAIDDQLIREIEKSHTIVSIEKKTPRTAVLELKEALNIEQRTHLRNLGVLHQTDVGFLPKHFKGSDIKVLAMDMDSTLINIECIDEIADAVGKKKEVSEITEAAMRGEIIDFGESLRKRVALLKGVPQEALDDVFTNRLRLNPGAKELVDTCKQHGMKVLLVSGGFTFFADRVQHILNIDFTRSNVLEIADGHLTGRLVDQPWGDICDGAEKRKKLLETCAELGIKPEQSIAMGDGANDLLMMGVAGLSVAYHAKPKVRERAMVSIQDGGLDRLLEIFMPRKAPNL